MNVKGLTGCVDYQVSFAVRPASPLDIQSFVLLHERAQKQTGPVVDYGLFG